MREADSSASRKLASRAAAATDSAVARAQRLPGATQVIAVVESERRSGASLLAGGIAYRLFFWLVSFGLVVAAITSFWVRSDSRSLVDAAKSFGLSGVASRSATSAVSDGAHGRWYLLVSGVVLLVYFGAAAVRAFRVACFVAWQLAPTRLRQPLRASAVFTVLYLVGVGVTLLASWVRHHDIGFGVVATAGTIVAFFGLALAGLYLLPRPDSTTLRSLVPGAALAAVGVTAIHLFTVYYLSGKLERSPRLYGTLGASTVVLLGLFLIARVMIAAMFLNATLERRSSPDPAER